jgi:hypothetical protein
MDDVRDGVGRMVTLLMVVIRKKAKTKKSFANMITLIRLHLMNYVELFEFVKDTYKAWRKANPPLVLNI